LLELHGRGNPADAHVGALIVIVQMPLYSKSFTFFQDSQRNTGSANRSVLSGYIVQHSNFVAVFPAGYTAN
jgi:hypothetical protein